MPSRSCLTLTNFISLFKEPIWGFLDFLYCKFAFYFTDFCFYLYYFLPYTFWVWFVVIFLTFRSGYLYYWVPSILSVSFILSCKFDQSFTYLPNFLICLIFTIIQFKIFQFSLWFLLCFQVSLRKYLVILLLVSGIIAL